MSIISKTINIHRYIQSISEVHEVDPYWFRDRRFELIWDNGWRTDIRFRNQEKEQNY